MMNLFKWKHSALFMSGIAVGTAGIKLLSSKDAKNIYAQITAATLRAADSMMTTVTLVQENAGDILAQANDINEERLKKEHETEPFGIALEEELAEESKPLPDNVTGE